MTLRNKWKPVEAHSFNTTNISKWYSMLKRNVVSYTFQIADDAEPCIARLERLKPRSGVYIFSTIVLQPPWWHARGGAGSGRLLSARWPGTSTGLAGYIERGSETLGATLLLSLSFWHQHGARLHGGSRERLESWNLGSRQPKAVSRPRKLSSK